MAKTYWLHCGQCKKLCLPVAKNTEQSNVSNGINIGGSAVGGAGAGSAIGAAICGPACAAVGAGIGVAGGTIGAVLNANAKSGNCVKCHCHLSLHHWKLM